MSETDLKLALALLEQPCSNCFPLGILAEMEPIGHCKVCGGTGKVPLLDPMLVRTPCPNVRPDEFGRLDLIDSYKQGLHKAERCACGGTGWFPSPKEMDWVRAFNKAGYDVSFKRDGQVLIYHFPNLNCGDGITLFEAAAQALGVADKEVTPSSKRENWTT